MYERFIEQLKMYTKVISEVRKALQAHNQIYDLVLSHLYLYYDMKLVTFGIDEQRNLIVHFPVFV